MPPKGKKPAAGGKGKGAEEETKDPLQAVVLADSFETRFAPFTLEQPRCLLPLANTPLIEYTLEFLANSGVEEVYIYCGRHTEKVDRYIQHSKWHLPSSPFNVTMIHSSSHSIGDAMRDLDKRGILINDFLIVYGDVVSNLPLAPALAAHRARRLADSNAIMTMVLREAGTSHRTKAQEVRPVFVIDPTKQRCLHFEQMKRGGHKKVVTIEADLFREHDELEIRQDLIDCGIDICTPAALALWSDNFDYEAPRSGFLQSVLKDYELNGKTIHTHIVNDHYAARVRNLAAYDAVSKDIVNRWAYPLAPDSNLLRGQSYRLSKGMTYKEDGVVLARSCVIGPKSIIGKDTSIGDGTVIKNSVVGRYCNIGKNVTIDGAYLWDNCTVQDGAVVKEAIIANEAVVGRRCTIEPGALISYEVIIGNDKTVTGGSRITRKKNVTVAETEELPEIETNPMVVGERGQGAEYVEEDDNEDEEPAEGLIPRKRLYLHPALGSDESISTLDSESDTDREPDHGDRSASFISIASDDSNISGHQAGDFHHDAAGSIFDSMHKGDAPENIQLELTALRMSTNASEHQVRKAVAQAFMKRIAEVVESGTTIKTAVQDVVSNYKTLIERTVFDKDKTGKVDQVDLLLLIQQDLVHRKDGDSILLFFCSELYNSDILEPEAIEQWNTDPKSSEGEEMIRVRAKMGPLLDVVLAESESEEESEEDEED